MPMTAALRRLRRLSWPQRLLLAEALMTLAAVSLAIKLLPFRSVVRMASRLDQPRPGNKARRAWLIGEGRWSVEAVACRVPWKAVCFQRGLALHVMLRRRGVPSVLHYGVANTMEKGLAAHVWLTADGKTIIGGEEADAFTCLATFPAASQS
jgi:hypothetical protein